MTVLVHGLGLSHRYFTRLQPLLPGSRAVDLQGVSMGEMTDSLERFVGPRTVLIANSLGAQIATELAVRSPSTVRALVLTGPTWDPAAPGVPSHLLRLLADSFREQRSLVSVALADYVRHGPRHLLDAARAMLRYPMAYRLSEVAVPVVVVRGSRDPICGEGWARRLAGAPPDGRLVSVPGAAHAVDWSHPASVARVVEELEGTLGER